MGDDASGPFRVSLLQGVEVLIELLFGGFDFPPHVGYLAGGGGGGEAGGGGDQAAGVLGDAEGGLQLRDAAFIDLGLGVSHPVEAEPGDETGGHGKGHSDAEGGEELGRDAKT